MERKLGRRRPIQDRSRTLVDGILSAASQIISGFGYDSATTNRIACRAGVSVGSLYQYFSNKDEILQGLLEHLIQQTQREVVECLACTLDIPVHHVCSHVVGTYVRLLRRHRTVLEAAFEHALGPRQLLVINAFEREMARWLQAYIAERGQGLGPSYDSALVAVQTISTLGARIAFETNDEGESLAAERRLCDMISVVLGITAATA